jgi:hypothetical protein
MSMLLRAFALLLGAGLPAQFQPGDLYSFAPSNVTNGYMVQRFDPAAASPTTLVHLHTTWSAQAIDAACYDPLRDRILVCAGHINATPELWAFDAAGAATSLGHSGTWLHHLTPRGDGIVYCMQTPGSLQTIRYLDATNALHVLMDSTGATPFAGPTPARMIYHPAHNALFVAENAWYPSACGVGTFTGDIVNVHRLPLSANGTRVVGPVACTTIDISTSSQAATGWSLLPDGDLLLTIDTNSNGGEPRLQRIDPSTLVATTFATTGPYAGAATVPAGVWSNRLGTAVVVDGSNQVLRSYAEGSNGPGVVLQPALAPGNSVQRLFEIGPIGAAARLSASPAAISLASGGVHTLTFDNHDASAASYWILGSLSGWNPGFDLSGVHVSANLDSYTFVTTGSPNAGILSGMAGPLPAATPVQATVTLPPGLPAFLTGFRLTHCAVAFDGAFQPLFASNPTSLLLLP